MRARLNALFRGRTTMGKSYLSNPFKINVFKKHSLKIFNLAQQNLTKLLCRNGADIRKAYIDYVSIYAYFLAHYRILNFAIVPISLTISRSIHHWNMFANISK